MIATPTHPLIHRARRLAMFMDSAITIPVINWKIGLDPLLDIVPWAGDLVGLLLSSYMLWVAYELRLPRHVYVRMTVNMLFDYLLGLVPMVGGVADAFWHANLYNVDILEKAWHAQQLQAPPQDVVIDVTATKQLPDD